MKPLKAELIIDQALINRLARQVSKRLVPVIERVRQGSEQDTLFDVRTLAIYLKASRKWIYERTHLKEIPCFKVKGLLRFRKKDIDQWLRAYNVPISNDFKHFLAEMVKNRPTDSISESQGKTR
jgi:excisionase family DNA binding protein